MIRPRTWNGPAQQPYFVNKNSSLSNGLAFGFGGHSGIDVVSGIRPSRTGTVTPTTYNGNRSSYFPSGSGNYYKFSGAQPSANLAAGPSTYAFYMSIDDSGATGWAFPASRTGLAVNNGGWSLRGSFNNIYFNSYFNNTRLECGVAATFPLNNTLASMIWTFDGGLTSSSVKCWVNGVQASVFAGITGVGTQVDDSAQDLYIGECHVPGFQVNSHLGHMAVTALANRVWSDAEIQQFARNPNTIFSETPTTIYSFSKVVSAPISSGGTYFKPRSIQPQSPTRLNGASPLSKGVIFAFTGGPSNMDLISGTHPTITNVTETTSLNKRTSTFAGGAINVSKLDFGLNLATAGVATGPTTWAVFALSNDGKFVPATQNDGNVNNQGWQLSDRTGETTIGFELVGSSGDLRRTITTAIPTGRPFTTVWTYKATGLAADLNIWVDGIQGTGGTQTNLTGTNVSAATHPLLLGQKQYGINNGAGSHNGQIYVFIIANRVWSEAEINSFNDNPYEMFAQPATFINGKDFSGVVAGNAAFGLAAQGRMTGALNTAAGTSSVSITGSATLSNGLVFTNTPISISATALGTQTGTRQGAGTTSMTMIGSVNTLPPGGMQLHAPIAGTVALWQLQSDLLDTSGHGYDLTMSGGSATYTTLSGSVNGFDFNGSRSMNPGVISDLELTGEFTIEFFALMRGTGVQTFFESETNGGNSHLLTFYWNGSSMSYSDQHINTPLVPAVTLGTSYVSANHFAFRRTSTGGGNYIVEIFVNGARRAGTLTTTGQTSNSLERLYIGGGAGFSNLNAILASIRVLNYSRADADIQADAAGTINLQPLVRLHDNITGCVGLWQFQGNKDDASGFGNSLSVSTGAEGYAELAGTIEGFDFAGTTRLASAAVSQVQQVGESTVQFLMRMRSGGTMTLVQTQVPAGTATFSLYHNGSVWAYADQRVNSAFSPNVLVSPYADGNVHHVTVRRTNTTGTTWEEEIFLDGVKQTGTVVSNPGGMTAAGTEVMYVGGYSGGPNFSGVLTSLRLLDYARSDGDILADYQNTIGNSGGFTITATATGSIEKEGDATGAIHITASAASLVAVAPVDGSSTITFGITNAHGQALSPVLGTDSFSITATSTGSLLLDTNILPFAFSASGTVTGNLSAHGNANILFADTGSDFAEADGHVFANEPITFTSSLFWITPLVGSISFAFSTSATLSGLIYATSEEDGTAMDFETSLRVSQQFGSSYDNMIELLSVSAVPSITIINRTTITGLQLMSATQRKTELMSVSRRTVGTP